MRDAFAPVQETSDRLFEPVGNFVGGIIHHGERGPHRIHAKHLRRGCNTADRVPCDEAMLHCGVHQPGSGDVGLPTAVAADRHALGGGDVAIQHQLDFTLCTRRSAGGDGAACRA